MGLSQDELGLSLGQTRGRPKGGRTKKLMFMCLIRADHSGQEDTHQHSQAVFHGVPFMGVQVLK